MCHLFDKQVQINDFHLDDNAAAERQELLCEARGAFTRIEDCRNCLSARCIGGHFREDQVAISNDDGQKIVEVMSDTTSKFPNGVHFLRLQELVFQTLSFRRITNHTGEMTFSIEPEFADREFNREMRCIHTAGLEFANETNDLCHVCLKVVSKVPMEFITVCLGHQYADGISDEFARRVPKQTGCGGIRGDNDTTFIASHNRIRDTFRNGTK